MTKHTPGPWVAIGREILSQALVDPEMPERGREIIAIHVGPHNANLIEAAPELLAELERLAKGFGWGSAHRIGRLVAKAKGEPHE